MTVALWITLSLLAWTVVPLPLAVVVGRLLRSGSGPEDGLTLGLPTP